MAKVSPSLIKFQGTLLDFTFVKSKAYRDHVRLKRGTHTPITINDAFKRSGKNLVKANLYAKIIKDAFEPYRASIKDGTAWSRLVALFKKTLAAGKPVDYTFLENFEFHSKHSLESIAPLRVTAVKHKKRNVLKLLCTGKVSFPDSLRIDSYALTVIVVFPLAKKRTSIVSSAEFFSDTQGKQYKYETEIALPKKFDAIVIGVKVNGIKEELPSFNLKANALGVVAVLGGSRTVDH
jgi:hypothetical protein